MIILCLRTDKPEAELYLYDGTKQLGFIKWQAHRELSLTLHRKIEELFSLAGADLEKLDGIVLYKGPGSFTGLRIGFSVANSMANIYELPIVASGGTDWISQGISHLISGNNDRIAQPEYGAPANITLPKK